MKNVNKETLKKVSILTFVVAIVLVVGGTLATFNFDTLFEGVSTNKLSTCKLSLNVKDDNPITLVDASPISDEKAKEYTPYTFTVTNKSGCDTAYYKITLGDICNTCTKTNDICTVNGQALNCSSTYKLNSSKIKYELVNKKTNEVVKDVNPENISLTGQIAKDEAINFELKLWIDSSATNEDLYVYENGKPKENSDGSIVTKNVGYKLSVEGQNSEFISLTGAEMLMTKAGTDGLEEVVHPADASLQIGATEDLVEYRYRGATPNNYVKFNNETWRIIGVSPTDDGTGNIENRIKIIRDDFIGGYAWSSGSYLWENSSLNSYLNGVYYNSLASGDKNMIGSTKYYLGYPGGDGGPSVYYQYERKSGSNNNYVNKIAIMYLSDYGYGAPDSCTASLSSYSSCSSVNWLFSSNAFWTIAGGHGDGGTCYWTFPIIGGDIYYDDQGDGGPCMERQYNIKPVLSLLTSVKITGGDGSVSNPYTLSL